MNLVTDGSWTKPDPYKSVVSNGRVISFTYFVVGIAGPAQVVGGGARREDAGGALCLTSAGVVILAENDVSVRTVKPRR